MKPQSSIYVLRNGTRSIGFVDNGKGYIVGFMQQTHAYLIKHNLVGNPMVRLDRKHVPLNGPTIQGIDIHIDMDATLSFLKANHGIPDERTLQVEKVDFDDFMSIPLQGKMGIAIPMELTQDDEEVYSFKAQVFDV